MENKRKNSAQEVKDKKLIKIAESTIDQQLKEMGIKTKRQNSLFVAQNSL